MKVFIQSIFYPFINIPSPEGSFPKGYLVGRSITPIHLSYLHQAGIAFGGALIVTLLYKNFENRLDLTITAFHIHDARARLLCHLFVYVTVQGCAAFALIAAGIGGQAVIYGSAVGIAWMIWEIGKKHLSSGKGSLVKSNETPLSDPLATSDSENEDELQTTFDWKSFPPIQNAGPFKAGISNAIGGREYMEDRFYIGESGTLPFFMVMDGHGNDKVANYLVETCQNKMELLSQSLDAIEAPNEEDFNQSVIATIKKSFEDWNAELEEKKNTFSQKGGSTLLASMVYKGKLIFANTGDCRAVVLRGTKYKQMTEDAKPYEYKFLKTIYKLGGFVCLIPEQDENDEGGRVVARVGTTLAVARAFGDFGVNGITAKPKVTILDLTTLDPNKGNFVILASDGVWDAVDAKKSAEILLSLNKSGMPLNSIAQSLIQTALKNGSDDNCTAIIIDLNGFFDSTDSPSSGKDEI